MSDLTAQEIMLSYAILREEMTEEAAAMFARHVGDVVVSGQVDGTISVIQALLRQFYLYDDDPRLLFDKRDLSYSIMSLMLKQAEVEMLEEAVAETPLPAPQKPVEARNPTTGGIRTVRMNESHSSQYKKTHRTRPASVPDVVWEEDGAGHATSRPRREGEPESDGPWRYLGANHYEEPANPERWLRRR